MIDIAIEYGLSAVEFLNVMHLNTPNQEEAKKIREYADQKNIKIPCFSVFINLADMELSEAVSTLKAYGDVAKILGSPFLHHTIIGEFREPQNVLPRKKELFEKGITAVREVYDYCASIGIRTIYEDQGYVFNGVDSFGEFLTTVNRNVGVVADFGNVHESKDGIVDFVKAFADKTVHVHLKDIIFTETNETGRGLPSLNGKFMNEVQIGTGIVDFKQCVSILKNAGYDGYYSLEYGAPADDSPAMDEVLAFTNKLLAE